MSRSALSIVMLMGFVAETMAGGTMSVTTCRQVVPPGTTAILAKTIVCPPWGVCYPPCVPGDPGCFQPLEPVVTCRSTAECPDPVNDSCPGVSLHDNVLAGISATKRASLENVVGRNNGILAGAAKRMMAMRVTATGNGIGLGSGGSLTIADSSITGSTSADIESVRRPRLRNVVCEKSAQLLLPQNTLGPPWGVCSDD